MTVQPHELFAVEQTTVYRDSTGTVHETSLAAARETTKQRLVNELIKHTSLPFAECHELAEELIKHHKTILSLLTAYDIEFDMAENYRKIRGGKQE